MNAMLLGYIVLFHIVTYMAAAAVPASGALVSHRTLVILEDDSLHATHSQLFELLQKRHHNITFASASATNVALHHYGEYLYDNVVLLAPGVEEFGGVDLDSIINFVDEGHNLFVAGAPGVSDTVRNVAGECGVEYDAEDTRVIDHFCFADVGTSQQLRMPYGDHTLLHSNSTVPVPVIVGDGSKSVLFREDLPPTLFPDPEMARDNRIYRVRDRLRYSVVVKERTVQGWVPFQAHDMQLEAVMLDPYVRTTLHPDSNGVFTAEFEAPDVHGVYQLRLLYRRPGYSTLSLSTQVSVRPLRHDEFERFIPAAYPYYARENKN